MVEENFQFKHAEMHQNRMMDFGKKNLLQYFTTVEVRFFITKQTMTANFRFILVGFRPKNKS